jgi:hypothetical protein
MAGNEKRSEFWEKIKQTFGTKGRMGTLITVVLICSGLFAILVFAYHATSCSSFSQVVSISLMTAGASLLVGGLLGFLFGIPRTLQQEAPAQPPSPPEAAVQAQAGGNVEYVPNTNLEQISDWLTKILVGVGLTQLTKMPGKLVQLSKYIGGGLGDTPGNEAFILVVLIYFVICGFLVGYLTTRLLLAPALRQADLVNLGERTERAEKATKEVVTKLKELQDQAQIDANALAIAQRQLRAPRGLPEVSQEDLDNIVAMASPTVRQQIWFQASEVRSQNWLKEENKPKMERTIPIFQALIKSDTAKRDYLSYGDLGFALKDQTDPNYKSAEAALTKAIEIRDAMKHEGWILYEYNRAVCRIKQDPQFKNGKPSKKQDQEKILADLRKVDDIGILEKLKHPEPDVKKWADLNKVELKGLS